VKGVLLASWLIFIQISIDAALFLALFLAWARLQKPPKEDARLSRGLQLLQSKISILEDLSDRTEVQVRQLSALLSSKAVEVHQKILEADRQIHAIEKSMQKSLEISKIFQDKIPHKEIVERENTFKYIEAARLAHQGVQAEEISKKLDIPYAEIQVIVNMNKDRLIFTDEEIPSWAKPVEEHVSPVATEPVTAPASPTPTSEPQFVPIEVAKEVLPATPDIKPYEFPRITKTPYGSL